MVTAGQIAITEEIYSEAKRQGLTPTQFADRAGKDHNTVCLVRRNGNIGIHLLLDFLKALDGRLILGNKKGERILCWTSKGT